MKATYKIYGIYKTCKPVYNRGSKKEKRERSSRDLFEEIIAKYFLNL